MKIKNIKVSHKVIRNSLYVLGTILLLYYIYLLYVSCTYIGGLVSVGEIKLSADFGKVIQYIMTQTFSYLFYSITLLTFGKIISICHKENQDIELNSEDK